MIILVFLLFITIYAYFPKLLNLLLFKKYLINKLKVQFL
jgi:hypothetical protein